MLGLVEQGSGVHQDRHSSAVHRAVVEAGKMTGMPKGPIEIVDGEIRGLKGQTGIVGVERHGRTVVLVSVIARGPPWSHLAARAVEAPEPFGRDRGPLCQRRRDIELATQQRELMNPD